LADQEADDLADEPQEKAKSLPKTAKFSKGAYELDSSGRYTFLLLFKNWILAHVVN
jgi:hypothetical protein